MSNPRVNNRLKRFNTLIQKTNREIVLGPEVSKPKRMMMPSSVSSESVEKPCIGKEVVIIGAGVAGLSTAYEILSNPNNDITKVTILEAHNRTGGRCWSIRDGEEYGEVKKDAPLNDNSIDKERIQKAKFEKVDSDSEPYLNAGPGRIPSGHTRVLKHMKKFKVDLEVYVMNSSSNLTYVDDKFDNKAVVNRRIQHSTRGHLAAIAYEHASEFIKKSYGDNEQTENLTAQLQELMIRFGGLTNDGKYVVKKNQPGEHGSGDRAGYTRLPGVDPGEVVNALSLEDLLDSKFWAFKFYQNMDYFWQPTLFQPVGGMDKVQESFAKNVTKLGGDIKLSCPVNKINLNGNKFVITYFNEKSNTEETIEADYCFSNAAIPFLEYLLGDDVKTALNPSFLEALQAVYKAEHKEDRTDRFLAYTTKVGWQAKRTLWQEPLLNHEDNETGLYIVPIYGGISWVDHNITQIWYPSSAIHDEYGVLTGCYNFGDDALEMGDLDLPERIKLAREGAEKLGKHFSDNLEHGVSVAWQNIPYIRGGWAQWHAVENSLQNFNTLMQGSSINNSDTPKFFIVGDQLSSLAGWQEGAIASAENAVHRMHKPSSPLPEVRYLCDTRYSVESI